MIRTEVISPNALRIFVPEKLKSDDFREIGPQVDSIISQFGKIRLLIDASQFSGWESIAAFENHAGFVKNHQSRVERIAVIVAHGWPHWLIGNLSALYRSQNGNDGSNSSTYEKLMGG